MSGLKCYLVDCDQENGAQLYFTETAGQAKRRCADEEGCDFTAISSCKRQPQYDEYAPGPVPATVLIEAGWWFECCGCGRRVEDDMEEADENGEPLCPTTDERYPDYCWCSEACRDKDIAEWEAKRDRINAAKLRLIGMYPDATIRDAWEAVDMNIRISFTVPGLKGNVNWTAGENTVALYPDDVPAWEAYKASIGRSDTEAVSA